MVRALGRGDRREFFRLLAGGQLCLPAFARDRSGAGPQRLITMDLFGLTYLPVFTSTAALAASPASRPGAYTITSYPELRRKWPDPAWRLAVNPGTPIDAYVAIDAVEGAALGKVVVPTAFEILSDAERRGGGGGAGAAAGAESGAAMRRRDTGYLRALLRADVIVPVTTQVGPERILDGDFPWLRIVAPRTDAGPGDPPACPTIEVFTSVATFRAGCAQPVPSVTVAMSSVVAAWPGDEDQLAIDPRSPLAVTLPGARVAGLASWALPEPGTGERTAVAALAPGGSVASILRG